MLVLESSHSIMQSRVLILSISFKVELRAYHLTVLSFTERYEWLSMYLAPLSLCVFMAGCDLVSMASLLHSKAPLSGCYSSLSLYLASPSFIFLSALKSKTQSSFCHSIDPILLSVTPSLLQAPLVKQSLLLLVLLSLYQNHHLAQQHCSFILG